MSEQNKTSISNMQGMDGFKPLSEEEEKHIAGGSAMMPARCKDDEYLDPNTGNCVKKSSQVTPTTI